MKDFVKAEEKIKNFTVQSKKQTEILNLASAINEFKAPILPVQSKPDNNTDKKKNKINIIKTFIKNFNTLTLSLIIIISKLKTVIIKTLKNPAVIFSKI